MYMRKKLVKRLIFMALISIVKTFKQHPGYIIKGLIYIYDFFDG